MFPSRLIKELLPLVSREFNVRRVRPIWTPEIIAPLGTAKDFSDEVEQALGEGVIDEDDHLWVRAADLILRSQRKSDGSTLWFTVEASGTINDDDINQSHHSANAIKKIYDQDAISLVYGYRIQEAQVRLAQELGVQVYIDPDSA